MQPKGTIPTFVQHGGSATAQYNFNRWLSAVGDFGLYHSGTENFFTWNTNTFTYMFGPRVSFRSRVITPYIQGLIGGSRFGKGIDPGSATAPRLPFSQNVLTAAVGVGLDINVTDHFAIKPVQLEWFMSRLESPSLNTDYLVHNYRYSGGVVFRWGSK